MSARASATAASEAACSPRSASAAACRASASSLRMATAWPAWSPPAAAATGAPPRCVRRPAPRAHEAGHVLFGRGQVFGNDRVHQLAQQQRIAAGLRVAGDAEDVVGSGQRLPQQLRDSRRAQRSELNHGRQRVGDDLSHHARVRPRLPGPQTDHHPHVQPVDPGQQIGQPAQREQVAPVQVVDREQQRPAVGHVRRQPVQAVQRRQRRVGARLGRELCGIEQRRRQTRRAGKQLGSLLRRQRGQERLEQLPHHAVGERPLQLGAAPAKNLRPGRLTQGLRLRDQRGLADARRPLDRQQPPAGLGRGEQPVDRRQLDVTLKQAELSRQRLPGHLRAAHLLRGLTGTGCSEDPTAAPPTIPAPAHRRPPPPLTGMPETLRLAPGGDHDAQPPSAAQHPSMRGEHTSTPRPRYKS